MLNIISVIMLIIGAIIGAGFASGKEIAFYFARFGSLAYILIIVFAFILFISIVILSQLSQKFPTKNLHQINLMLFGIKFGKIINILIYFSILITASAMIAGFKSLFGGFVGEILAFLSCFFCYNIAKNGLKNIKIVSSIIVPIIVSFIVYVLIFSTRLTPTTISTTYKANYNIISGLISLCAYAGGNIILSASSIVETTKSIPKKHYLIASVVLGIIFALILSFYLIILFAFPSSLSSSMPMLNVVMNINISSTIIYIFILWCSIFTTFTICTHACSSYTNSLIKDNNFSILINIMLAYILSFFGFDKIIEYGYFYFGLFGFIYLISLFVLLRFKKNNSPNYIKIKKCL